ncbi:hypothetical protein IFR05_009536 [Cadophora sp. M221]|nr:hypothetical protein IFR05_009536 [Cadophora sp. M221]
MSPLDATSDDVLRAILDECGQRELYQLSLVNRRLLALAESGLYSTIQSTWTHTADPITFLLLRSVLARPVLATKIRKLVFRSDRGRKSRDLPVKISPPTDEEALMKIFAVIRGSGIPHGDATLWTEEIRRGWLDGDDHLPPRGIIGTITTFPKFPLLEKLEIPFFLLLGRPEHSANSNLGELLPPNLRQLALTGGLATLEEGDEWEDPLKFLLVLTNWLADSAWKTHTPHLETLELYYIEWYQQMTEEMRYQFKDLDGRFGVRVEVTGLDKVGMGQAETAILIPYWPNKQGAKYFPVHGTV